MAYLDDDFQGYAIGTNAPFGSWILDPSVFGAQIVAGFGPDGTDRSFQITLGTVSYVRAMLTTFSQFVACRKTTGGEILDFANGPNGTSHTFTLLQIKVEVDGSITASCPASGDVFGNSVDVLFEFYAVNFLHVKVTLSDVVVMGTAMVHVACDIVLNGVTALSFSVTTSFAVSNLTNLTSEVNRFELATNGAFYDAYTLDTPKALTYYPHPGAAPKVRVTQAVGVVNQLPDSGKVLILQAVCELNMLIANRWYISES